MTETEKDQIIIEHLTKTFEDITAVDDLSLNVPKGELFGLLGPNGAGKTTTLNVLCGITPPTKGTIIVGGYDVVRMPGKVKSLIGVCPQDTAVFSHLTGRENIQFFGNLHTLPRDRLAANVNMLLERIGFSDDADRRVSKYSGGMRRRINLAMALVHDPQIAFLDEPTVAMDPQSRHAVWDFIKELKKQEKTIILTTHYMEEAEELCDRVGIIDYGKLIALGSPDHLKDTYNARNLEGVFIELTGRRIREEV
ncbi:MAG: ATP-binding cassette domain-containing protein [Theionarchaea archaeon]|nr:ATP-binding cassette domain-containing protein [Theionarchaea archaeon]